MIVVWIARKLREYEEFVIVVSGCDLGKQYIICHRDNKEGCFVGVATFLLQIMR